MTLKDEKEIDDFCQAMKDYWNACPEVLRTAVKVGALDSKLTMENYLKGGLGCVWGYYQLKANEKRRFQIVE